MKNNFLNKQSLLLIVLFFISNCNLSDADEVVDNREVVEGLYYTNEMSPEILNIFGEPAELIEVPIRDDSFNQHDPNIPEAFFVSVPYPNPAIGRQNVNNQIPRSTSVKFWIEEARWSESPPRDVKEPRSVEIIDNLLGTGFYQYNLGGLLVKCRGGDFEEGFYRINVQAYDTTLFVDLFLLGNRENMPDEMKEMAEGYLGCQ